MDGLYLYLTPTHPYIGWTASITLSLTHSLTHFHTLSDFGWDVQNERNSHVPSQASVALKHTPLNPLHSKLVVIKSEASYNGQGTCTPVSKNASTQANNNNNTPISKSNRKPVGGLPGFYSPTPSKNSTAGDGGVQFLQLPELEVRSTTDRELAELLRVGKSRIEKALYGHIDVFTTLSRRDSADMHECNGSCLQRWYDVKYSCFCAVNCCHDKITPIIHYHFPHVSILSLSSVIF